MPGPSWRDYNPLTDDLGEACITANVRVGNNSDAGGAWEYSVEDAYGQRTWGVNGGGYLDSTSTQFMLTLEPGGGTDGVIFAVGDSEALDYGGKTYDCINKVCIQVIATNAAGAEGPVHIAMTDVAVAFYYSGNCPSIPNSAPNGEVGDAARKLRPPHDGPRESGIRGGISPPSILVIDAPTSVCGCPTRVVVTGYVHLWSEDPAHKVPPQLGQNQLIGHIFVWTDDCEEV